MTFHIYKVSLKHKKRRKRRTSRETSPTFSNYIFLVRHFILYYTIWHIWNRINKVVLL